MAPPCKRGTCFFDFWIQLPRYASLAYLQKLSDFNKAHGYNSPIPLASLANTAIEVPGSGKNLVAVIQIMELYWIQD